MSAMSAVIASLEGLFKAQVASFRLSAIFPAIFFILLNWVFILPHFKGLQLYDDFTILDIGEKALIISLSALLLGYPISAFQVPVIRLYEGYPWKESPFGKIGTAWQCARKRWLENKVTELSVKRRNTRHIFPQKSAKIQIYTTEIAKYTSELRNDFPRDASRILPTRLGNVVSTFEAYPGEHYGMDGVTYWPRMVSVLEEVDFLPNVTRARSTVEFVLNTSLLMGIFAVECLLLRILVLQDITWVLPLAAFSAAWVFYLASIDSARNWAALFRVGFDLYRYHLADALGLEVQTDLEKEREQWRNLSRFLNSQGEISEFSGFNHSPKNWPVRVSVNQNGGK